MNSDGGDEFTATPYILSVLARISLVSQVSKAFWLGLSYVAKSVGGGLSPP